MIHRASHDGIRRLAVVLALIAAWGLGLATPVRGQPPEHLVAPVATLTEPTGPL